MSLYFYVKLDSGTSPGPYDLYHDSVSVGNLLAIYDDTRYAENLTWDELTNGNGVAVIVPDGSTSIIILNKVGGLNLTQVIPFPTPTPTVTVTSTPTQTITPTVTPTITPTNSVTPTITPTVTVTPTNTVTPTVTVTPTQTINCSFGISVTILTPTPTPTMTVTPTNTITPTVTITPTNSITPTITVTPTRTVTPTITPTNTVTPTITPTVTVTPTTTITPTITPTVTITPTRTMTPTPTLPALQLSVSSSSLQSCYNVSDASFTLSASGGNGAPYEYSKDNVNWQVSATFSSLAGTTWTGYVRNNNRLGTVTSVSVGSLARSAPAVNIVSSNIACYGAANGSITVSSPSGGIGGPYATKLVNSGGTVVYDYQTLTTSRTYSSLGPDTYTVYVKDSSTTACERTYSIGITQPASAVSISVTSATAPTCSYNADGSIIVSGSGGTGTITYSKDGTNYQSSGTFGSLSNGTYTLYAKDANGCVASTSSTINRPAMAPTLTVSNVSCFGSANGQVALTAVSGGAGTISSWTWIKEGDTIVRASNYIYASLTPGTYSFTIYDANNCTYTTSVTITQPTAQSVSISGIVAATAANNDGQLTMTSSGGTWPKTYYLYRDTTSPYTDNPTDNLVATYSNVTSGSPTKTNTSLPCGYYWLRVVDANGCTTDTVESNVPCTVTVGGSFTAYYGTSGASGSGTACSMVNPTTLYVASGAAASLNTGQTYYTSSGFPYDGTSYPAWSDGNVYGTMSAQGVFTQVGTCL